MDKFNAQLLMKSQDLSIVFLKISNRHLTNVQFTQMLFV